jgi:hypothetical protein
MDVPRAEDTVAAMYVEDDFGRPDVVTSLSRLRAAFPVSTCNAVLCDSNPTSFTKHDVALRSLGLWRSRETAVTKAAAFLMSLNPGTPPPDAEPRSTSASCEECWIDLTQLTPKLALQSVGDAIQMQYEK